jgi:hypothetical protein
MHLFQFELLSPEAAPFGVFKSQRKRTVKHEITIWIAEAHRGEGKRFVLRVILSISRNAVSFSSARTSKLPPQCKK